MESRFPPWDPARGAPDGIIVLGGAIDPSLSRAHGETALSGNAERMTAIAKLARAYPKARIVYSGGDASLFGDAGARPIISMPLLESFGVPRERVSCWRRRSRNTFENALFSKALVKPKPGERWLLVTSAQHMPRAIGCFRRVGFAGRGLSGGLAHACRAGNLSLSLQFARGLRPDGAVHEWLGLLVYWLTGRTSELFPGPHAGEMPGAGIAPSIVKACHILIIFPHRAIRAPEVAFGVLAQHRKRCLGEDRPMTIEILSRIFVGRRQAPPPPDCSV